MLRTACGPRDAESLGIQSGCCRAKLVFLLVIAEELNVTSLTSTQAEYMVERRVGDKPSGFLTPSAVRLWRERAHMRNDAVFVEGTIMKQTGKRRLLPDVGVLRVFDQATSVVPRNTDGMLTKTLQHSRLLITMCLSYRSVAKGASAAPILTARLKSGKQRSKFVVNDRQEITMLLKPQIPAIAKVNRKQHAF